MLDHLINKTINFYHSLPQLLRHLGGSLKRNWKWLGIPFGTSILLFLVMVIGFKVGKTTEETQAVWYYRYIGLITLIWILVTIYFNTKRYHRDYFEYKNFNYPASFKTIVYTMIFSIGLFLNVSIVVLAKPVNLDSSFRALLFYWLMWMIFIILVSQVLGILRMICSYQRFDFILYAVFVLMFFAVPILFIPSEKPSIWMHILMLNPLFYLVSGIEEAVIIGINSVGNIPYHFYFIVWIGIAGLLLYILRPYMTYEKFRMTRHRSIHLKNTAEPEKVKPTNITN